MSWTKHISSPISITPLAVFRVLFGFIMMISIIRFMANGWVEEQYVSPTFYFSYYGFEWVKPLGLYGMYIIFGIMAVAAFYVMLGYFYKSAITIFFVTFTYVELLDKTNYLNHYYFVSIIAFLLIFLPANRSFSLDVMKRPSLKRQMVPAWCINILKLQLGLVYFYAGLAKLNADWLFNAMPLKIWLPAKAHLAFIGPFLEMDWVPFAFSWGGAFYDLIIVFVLINASTRIYGYMAVVVFHLVTSWLFQIGMFPYIMIMSTLIFFSSRFHERFILTLQTFWHKLTHLSNEQYTPLKAAQSIVYNPGKLSKGFFLALFTLYFSFQLLVPLRHNLYPGNLFWTEEGYRFSWRVMLMEKAGSATFHIFDPQTKKSWQVANWKYLTPVQEKMMATQPDMILQFAHFLKKKYVLEGITSPKITAECYVTLNGRRSQLLIDPNVDLTQKKESFLHKEWVLKNNLSGKLAWKN